MRSWNFQADGAGWRMPIEDRGVSRCIVDHAFSIEFHDSEHTAVLRVEGNFTIIEQERSYPLTPSAPMELGPAVALFGAIVRSARASADGNLEIAFDDGRKMSVTYDARYEAWELYGPGGMRAVCAPGGTMLIWQPQK